MSNPRGFVQGPDAHSTVQTPSSNYGSFVQPGAPVYSNNGSGTMWGSTKRGGGAPVYNNDEPRNRNRGPGCCNIL